MHDETKGAIVENTFGTLGAIVKDRLIHRNRMDRLEAEKEHDMEIARIRQGLTTDEEAVQETVDEVSTATEPTPAEIEAAIDELIAEEMCAVCQELLRGLKQRTPQEQVRGIFEYGRFKDSLDQDAGVDELKALIAQTEVLHAVLEENLSPGG